MLENQKIRDRKFYYKEKVMNLNYRLQLELGDARSRICNCETHIENAYRASKGGISSEMEGQWNLVWKELTVNENLTSGSSVCKTVRLKRNKSMKKYLDFFHNELLRVLNKDFLS